MSQKQSILIPESWQTRHLPVIFVLAADADERHVLEGEDGRLP